MSDRAPGDRVALCVARFYAELADRLEAGARAALADAGVSDVDRFEVPGAFELPLVTAYAARSGHYDAVICLGAVIRGETDHYDYVCTEAARGIQQVQLETGVPCGFGVLTVDSMAQALERVTGGSKRDTGRAAAEAALASLTVKRSLEPGSPGGEPGSVGGEPGSVGGEPGSVGGEPGSLRGEPGSPGSVWEKSRSRTIPEKSPRAGRV